MPPLKTLVVGLGNPILGDDGVGWRVAEEVQRQIETASSGAMAGAAGTIDIDYCALGGLSLMERLVGYDRAIVIDALTAGQPPGAVTCRPLDELPDAAASVHTRSAHDASLQVSLQLGRRLGAKLPTRVLVVGIEPAQLYDFSDNLSPAVAAAVPQAVRVVLDSLDVYSAEEDSYGLT